MAKCCLLYDSCGNKWKLCEHYSNHHCHFDFFGMPQNETKTAGSNNVNKSLSVWYVTYPCVVESCQGIENLEFTWKPYKSGSEVNENHIQWHNSIDFK